jgi:hypothetical protein
MAFSVYIVEHTNSFNTSARQRQRIVQVILVGLVVASGYYYMDDKVQQCGLAKAGCKFSICLTTKSGGGMSFTRPFVSYEALQMPSTHKGLVY